MRKKVFGRKLSRERNTRRALFRSLMRAMILNGKIVTTKAKAKAIQGNIENLVSLSKNQKVSAKRKVYSKLANDRSIADIIFNKISPAFLNRNGGYTRIINLSRRNGDLAPIVRLEWTESITFEEDIKKNNQKKDESKKIASEVKENKSKKTVKNLKKKKSSEKK